MLEIQEELGNANKAKRVVVKCAVCVESMRIISIKGPKLKFNHCVSRLVSAKELYVSVCIST